MIDLYYISIVAIVILTIVVNAQPDGWRMIDRFHGFRYELTGITGSVGLVDIIVNRADELGCFGWIQKSSKSQTLVGEVRCNKIKGEIMMQWIQSIPEINVSDTSKAKILVYPDTKIRLHFSSFKVLDDDRDTCFLDEPHKCDNITVETSDNSSNLDANNKNDEL